MEMSDMKMYPKMIILCLSKVVRLRVRQGKTDFEDEHHVQPRIYRRRYQIHPNASLYSGTYIFSCVLNKNTLGARPIRSSPTYSTKSFQAAEAKKSPIKDVLKTYNSLWHIFTNMISFVTWPFYS